MRAHRVQDGRRLGRQRTDDVAGVRISLVAEVLLKLASFITLAGVAAQAGNTSPSAGDLCGASIVDGMISSTVPTQSSAEICSARSLNFLFLSVIMLL
jgi:hypothetical protein